MNILCKLVLLAGFALAQDTSSYQTFANTAIDPSQPQLLINAWPAPKDTDCEPLCNSNTNCQAFIYKPSQIGEMGMCWLYTQANPKFFQYNDKLTTFTKAVNQTFNYLQNSEIAGSDLMQPIPATDYYHCQVTCISTPGCAAFQLSTNGTDCQMKTAQGISTVFESNSTDVFIMASPVAEPRNLTFSSTSGKGSVGGDLHYQLGNVASCEQTCGALANCQGFVFHNSTNKCVFKSNFDPQLFVDDADSTIYTSTTLTNTTVLDNSTTIENGTVAENVNVTLVQDPSETNVTDPSETNVTLVQDPNETNVTDPNANSTVASVELVQKPQSVKSNNFIVLTQVYFADAPLSVVQLGPNQDCSLLCDESQGCVGYVIRTSDTTQCSLMGSLEQGSFDVQTTAFVSQTAKVNFIKFQASFKTFGGADFIEQTQNSLIECTNRCLGNSDCKSLSYNKIERTCNLYASVSSTQDESWDSFTKL